MTTLDLTKVVETAALVIRQTWQTDATTTDITNHDRTDARAAIEAALPHIRAQIAKEIRQACADDLTHELACHQCYDAARVAEGQ